MVTPPATAKPHLDSEDHQMHSQFVNVMLILLQTINGIIEATPNDMGPQNAGDDEKIEFQTNLDDKLFESENSGNKKCRQSLPEPKLINEENKELPDPILINENKELKAKLKLMSKEMARIEADKLLFE